MTDPSTSKPSEIARSDEQLLAISDLTQKDRIQILLSEYSALRAEYVSRTGVGFQLLGFGVTAAAFLLGQNSGSGAFHYVVILFVLIAFGLGIFTNVRDLRRVAVRLKQLEHEINSRAGESLLVWETLGDAINSAGMLRGFLTRVETLDRSKLDRLDPKYLLRNKAAR
jgi:hypothetical protein